METSNGDGPQAPPAPTPAGAPDQGRPVGMSMSSRVQGRRGGQPTEEAPTPESGRGAARPGA
eukprot:12168638-Heterocapsa_arctica.AAC.1